MKLEIGRNIMKIMVEEFGSENPAFMTQYSYGSENIDSHHLTEEELEQLKTICSRKEHSVDINNRRVVRGIKSLQKLAKEGNDKPIGRLQAMTEAITNYLMPLPHHWIFVEDEFSAVMKPYFVKTIEYHPPHQRSEDDYVPAYIELKAVGWCRGQRVTAGEAVHQEDLQGGITVGELLGNIGWIPETEEMVVEHEKYVAYYNECCDKMGEQFLGYGVCKAGSDNWQDEIVDLEKHGMPSKLVMDNDQERGSRSRRGRDDTSPIITCTLWCKKPVNLEDEDDVDEDATIRLPVHPIVQVFILSLHEYAKIHVANIKDYDYDEKMADKLVLSDDRRELIDLLIGSERDGYSDIVEGKGKGVIILTSGPPGTGKTLTAEVFSEKVHKPLYIVQCSQLGTDPDELEKHLADVLEKATRWDAILLIDEADVYIHERGDDVDQNAIVGVFLRLLEYYSGVLFLTTNRATVIDDAIISRVMAHIRYDLPTYDEKVKLWKVLSEQYGVKLSAELRNDLAKEKLFKRISGRSIKQLCRLGKALAARRECEIDANLIKWVARFQDIEL